MARHGRSGGDRRALVQRVLLAAAFLAAVAVVPTLLVTLPHRDDPAAAPPPAPVTTTATPTPTATPTATRPAPTTSRAAATPTRPRPAPATTAPGGVRLPVAAPVATGPPPPRTPFQEFPSVCAPAAAGTLGGVPGEWFGVAPGGAGTSCLYGTDRSRYWVPAVRNAGAVLRPSRAEVYYKSGIRDYSLVRPFPAGFTMSSPTAAEAQAAGGFASWSCGEGDALTFPATCPAGSRLVLRLQGPSCWDGARLDSPDSRSHLAWPLDDRCPGGHPVPVPKVELVVFYPLPAGRLDLSVATGGGPTVRYRFVDGWDPAAERRLVAACVNRGARCDEDGRPT